MPLPWSGKTRSNLKTSFELVAQRAVQRQHVARRQLPGPNAAKNERRKTKNNTTENGAECSNKTTPNRCHANKIGVNSLKASSQYYYQRTSIEFLTGHHGKCIWKGQTSQGGNERKQTYDQPRSP